VIRKYEILPPTDAQKELCAKFAKDSVYSNFSYYAQNRNQDDLIKVRNDIYIGKCAEYSVYNAFSFIDISEPDTNIYNSYEKSYDCDLYAENLEIHVKAHRPTKFPVSWLFQPNEKVVYQPNKNELLALCDLERPAGGGALYLMTAEYAVDLYKDPLSPKLAGKKKCIYLKDIINDKK
jgi:hypothetical protein